MARMILPLNTQSEFIWTVNARSLMNFLALRLDSHAQFEIREYAQCVAKIFKVVAPITYDAFNKNFNS